MLALALAVDQKQLLGWGLDPLEHLPGVGQVEQRLTGCRHNDHRAARRAWQIATHHLGQQTEGVGAQSEGIGVEPVDDFGVAAHPPDVEVRVERHRCRVATRPATPIARRRTPYAGDSQERVRVTRLARSRATRPGQPGTRREPSRRHPRRCRRDRRRSVGGAAAGGLFPCPAGCSPTTVSPARFSASRNSS